MAIRADLIAEKSLRLEELRAQQRALHRLSCRNALRQTEPSARIYIPFIVVRTDAATEIDVEVEDSQEAVSIVFSVGGGRRRTELETDFTEQELVVLVSRVCVSPTLRRCASH